jgi:hypothetical protein
MPAWVLLAIAQIAPATSLSRGFFPRSSSF